jgi:hypothetical protein
MSSQVDGIEERIRELVETLGNLPGIIPVASSGSVSVATGHHGAGDEFFVDFNVDVLAGGWRSLNILVFATSQTDTGENFAVTAWPNTDEPTDCLSFKLCGIKSADPGELAEAIERVLEGDYSGHDEPSGRVGG